MKYSVLSFLAAGLLTTPVYADITIGLGAPLTGSYAVFGEQMKRGAEQSVADINASGGVLGEKLVLREFDDACDPRQGVMIANQMVSSGIRFVVGHYCSGCTIPASKVYNDENVFMITPAATSPTITEQGFSNVFRFTGRGDQLGPVIAQYIIKHYSNQKIAIVQDQSTYGRVLADEMKKSLNAGGVNEVLYEPYAAGQRDYSALISKLKQLGVQVLFVAGYHTETGLITRQIKEQKANIQVIGGNALVTNEFLSIAGPAAEGVLLAYGPDPRGRDEAKGAVNALRKNGFEPEGYTLYSYGAVQVIAEGIKRAGSSDPQKVEKAVHQGPLHTVFGPVSFDAKGDLAGFHFQMYRWHNGQYVELGD